MRRTLRDLIPQLEIDWLLPAWLLVAILAAFIAETTTIGLAVGRLYDLWSGWAIGGVVASAQAIGSMMWSRATQHNAQRVIRYKWMGSTKKGNRRRVENAPKSEPPLSVWAPGSVSVLAGIVSAWLAGALYGADGALTPLDVALAIAAPAGSISAALLNGVFAYGESAVARWQEESSRPHKQPELTIRPSVRTVARLQPDTAREWPDIEPDIADTSPALAGHLVTLRTRLADQRAQGARRNGAFRRAEAAELLSISDSYAKNLVAYGLERGVLTKARKRYHYQFTTQ